ncbi:MAG: hypothetical protein ACI9N1_002182 [Flavobacteriales bacterium]|jgi:hypothetical protein
MRTKTLFAAALVGLGSMANAQTTQMSNDAGAVITPEAGDWAIGFNAAPILNYAGNMFNGTIGNSMGSAFVGNDQAIYGKYFVDENTAYRASLRIMYGSGSNGVNIDTNTVSSAPSYVTNTGKFSGAGIVLGGGIEKRKGHNRLQGYYGGEAMITLGGTTPNAEYTYATALDSTNIADNVMNTDPSLNPNMVNTAANGRTLSTKAGSTFGIGVRGFIGAEYFFAPKMSIAAEYGWGLTWSTTGGGETVTENFGFDGASATTETLYNVTSETPKSSSLNIDTDNLGGAIRLMFHF